MVVDEKLLSPVSVMSGIMGKVNHNVFKYFSKLCELPCKHSQAKIESHCCEAVVLTCRLFWVPVFPVPRDMSGV